jgi:hypothetical protein
MIPSLVREMLPEERSMVLSDWKKDLRDDNPPWGTALRAEEWWALVNHVLDNHTLPSVAVWMACHRNEPDIALCWLASRAGILHMHATKDVMREPTVAAHLHRLLLDHVGEEPITFNPFLELKAQCPSSR